MNPKTEEVLIITLAIVILVATYVIIDPSITGLAILEPSFTLNDNIINNNGIQLKQHNLTETWTTNQTYYYTLTFAEENGGDKLTEISQLDSSFVELDTQDILKIKFNNVLQDQDKLNLFLSRADQRTMYVCDFNTESSCENQTIYTTLNYPGVEGNYQVTLDLPSSTDQMAIYSADGKLKFDYINASHLEITEHQNITYYYNSDSIESDVIQPENLHKWDIFTADYTLNNQIINFYYKTNQDYIEFTPPYNFSEIDSETLQFKLTLNSDNSSTPIINNLTINYIIIPPCQENWICNNWTQCINETQTRICTDLNECGTQENKPEEIQNCTEPPQENSPPPNPPSSGKPSTTRYSSQPAAVAQPAKTTNIQTKTVSQPITLKSTPEPEITQPAPKPKIKIIGNSIGFSYLAFLSFLLYRRRRKL